MFDAPAIVYVATNVVTGRCYVGVTHKSIDERRKRHELDARARRRTCRLFHEAIREYGADAFDWRVLVRGITFAEALREEVRLIAAIRPEYNLTAGGQGTRAHERSARSRAKQKAAMVGRRHSPETVALIAEKNRGKKRTAEQRERMGAARRGKPFSAAHRENLSRSLAGSERLREVQRVLWKSDPELAAKRLAGLVRYREQREA